jgi:translation initiation factor 2 alpha subunit (eIF-2alpha)
MCSSPIGGSDRRKSSSRRTELYVSVEVRTVLTAVERYRIDITADNPKRVSRNLQNMCAVITAAIY